MKIVSDFHDYYDVAMKQGVDQSILWIRKEKKIEDKDLSFKSCVFVERFDGDRYSCTAHFRVIGFCGKVIPLVEIDVREIKNAFLYDIESVDEFINSKFDDDFVDWYYNNRKNNPKFRPRYMYKYYGIPNRVAFVKFFEEWEQKKDKFHDLFVEHNTPVFVTHKEFNYNFSSLPLYSIVINPCLKNYDFFKVKDVYTAYQDISMFMAGLANPQKPIPEISDKDMLVAKGYDSFSFKKPKGTKRNTPKWR